MNRNRALITAAVAVTAIAAGTVVAALNLGWVGTNHGKLPVDDLDGTTITSSAGATSSVAGPIRVEIVDGVVHIYQPDGSMVTVPLPTTGQATAAPANPQAETASTAATTQSDPSSPVTTRNRNDDSAGHNDD